MSLESKGKLTVVLKAWAIFHSSIAKAKRSDVSLSAPKMPYQTPPDNERNGRE